MGLVVHGHRRGRLTSLRLRQEDGTYAVRLRPTNFGEGEAMQHLGDGAELTSEGRVSPRQPIACREDRQSSCHTDARMLFRSSCVCGLSARSSPPVRPNHNGGTRRVDVCERDRYLFVDLTVDPHRAISAFPSRYLRPIPFSEWIGRGLACKENADVRDESCALRRCDRSNPGAASDHGIRRRSWVAPGAGHGASLGLQQEHGGRTAALPSIREAGWRGWPLDDGVCCCSSGSAGSRSNLRSDGRGGDPRRR